MKRIARVRMGGRWFGWWYILGCAWLLFHILTIIPTEASSPAPVVNEVLAWTMGDAPTWIELYNPADADVDVTGWQIYSQSRDAHIELTPPAPAEQVSIPARGWLVIEFEQPFLNSYAGDTVKLYDRADTLIDSFTYTGNIPARSYARIPDGSHSGTAINYPRRAPRTYRLRRCLSQPSPPPLLNCRPCLARLSHLSQSRQPTQPTQSHHRCQPCRL